jgi:tetratricopeptide (TPR) repeat protein
MRGRTLYEGGNYESAIADYSEAIRLNSQSIGAYINRALAHTALGKHEKAIADYTEVVRIAPKYASAYDGRASARYALNDHTGAIADYTEVIRLVPHLDDSDVFYNRGRVYYDKGEFDNAIADFDTALQLNSFYVLAYYWRANAKKAKHDIRGAIESYQKYLDYGGRKERGVDRETVKELIRELKAQLE